LHMIPEDELLEIPTDDHIWKILKSI